MGKRYLTFDCYGTLVDWRKGIETELRSAIGSIGIGGQELLGAYVEAEKAHESSYKTYHEVLSLTALSLSGRLGVRVTDAGAEQFAASVPRWPVFPDTRKFLRDVGAKGYRRYILSNVDDDMLRGTIDRNGLEVDGFVTAEEVGSYKPDPGHWLRFMQKTGAEKGEVLHVAQSIFHDIVPTQKLGIRSAWVNRYHEPIPRGPQPQFISDNLSSLGDLLD